MNSLWFYKQINFINVDVNVNKVLYYYSKGLILTIILNYTKEGMFYEKN